MKRSKRSLVVKHAKRSQAQREAFARLAGIPIEQLTKKPTKRVVTIWERCKVCAKQMVGGPRCFEHNPTPEQRELASISSLGNRDSEHVAVMTDPEVVA